MRCKTCGTCAIGAYRQNLRVGEQVTPLHIARQNIHFYAEITPPRDVKRASLQWKKGGGDSPCTFETALSDAALKRLESRVSKAP